MELVLLINCVMKGGEKSDIFGNKGEKMSTIKIRTNDQQLSIISAPIITSGDNGVDYLSVEFDSTWDGFTERYAVFYIDKNDPYQAVIDNGQCPILTAVTQSDGSFYFGIWARDASAEKVKTSALLRYEVLPGAPTDGVVVSTWDAFWAKLESGSGLFNGKRIEPNPPVFPTYNMTSAKSMFQSSNVQNVTLYINNVTTLENFAAYSTTIKTVTFLGVSDSLTTLRGAFQSCTGLEQIMGEFDATNFAEGCFSYCFTQCRKLKQISIRRGTLSYSMDVSQCSSLSYESAVNLLEACREITTTQTVKFNPAVYTAELDSLILDTVAKGWTVAFGSVEFLPGTEVIE